MATVQLSAAIELCLCNMDEADVYSTSTPVADLPACHQVASSPNSSTSTDSEPITRHDHSGCDCEIEAPDDPQQVENIVSPEFQKFTLLYHLIETDIETASALSHFTHTSPQGSSGPPLYKITQRYLN